jgi:hypothetical protein
MLEIFLSTVALFVIILITKQLVWRSKLQSLKNKHVVVSRVVKYIYLLCSIAGCLDYLVNRRIIAGTVPKICAKDVNYPFWL